MMVKKLNKFHEKKISFVFCFFFLSHFLPSQLNKSDKLSVSSGSQVFQSLEPILDEDLFFESK